MKSLFRRSPNGSVMAKSSIDLKLFNTLSGKKEVFVSLTPGEVSMYNCGPTVYDYQHIGNLRPYVFADILKRTLVYSGYRVAQVINITDVGHLTGDNEGDADTGEDKVEAGSRKAGISARELSERITTAWQEDLQRLNINTQEIVFTRATDYIREQIALAQTLDEKGYAYKTDDGLYFDTEKFKDYGNLGNINLEHLQAGARVEMGGKHHPTDFALWKFSRPEDQRQQEWDSPWGKGFPGWHLECTAMIFAQLGKQIDIHTGGIDHIPVHHNNEIAQAEAVTGKQYVKYWLHNAFITIDHQKISKSMGNTVRLAQLMDRGFLALSYRYWLLTGHYRSPLNFTWEALEGAQTAYKRLLKMFVEELGTTNGATAESYRTRFRELIHDDLDTPQVIALMWELVKNPDVSKPDKRATLLEFDNMLGLGLIEGNERIKSMLEGTAKRIAVSEAPENIQKLVEEREEAREAKDWQKADELRDSIAQEGFTIIDSKEGPELEQKE